MAEYSIPARGTGTDGPVSFDMVTGSGTATALAVQHVKILSGIAGAKVGLTINPSGAAAVEQMTSATIPVSVSSAATLPIAGTVGLGVSATVPVSVSSAATLPITGTIGLGVSATVPVSVSSAATLPVSSLVRNTATGPVIVQHVSTATVPVSLTTLPTTATIPIAGTVGLGVSATVPVSVSSAATLAVILTNVGLPSAATIPVTVGSASNSIGKVEDTPHQTGDVGVMVMGVRTDVVGTTLAADGDYHPLEIDDLGNVRVRNLGQNQNDTGVSSFPMLTGAAAQTPTDAAPSTVVSADGDAVRQIADRTGAIYVLPHGPRIWTCGSDILLAAGVTDLTLKAAAATGNSHYIGSILMNWSPAASATTRPYIAIGTGAASVICRGYSTTRSDVQPISITWQPPMKITASTAITFSSTATETGFLFVKMTGYTAP